MTAAEIASYAALLGTLGTGAWTVGRAFLDGKDARQKRLDEREDRERREDAEELRLLRASYAALFGVLQVLVDHLIITRPEDPALDALANNLKAAFPVPTDMPTDMSALVRRIDARPHFGGKR